MDGSSKVVRYGLKKAFGYIEKDPEKNMMKLMDFWDQLAGDNPDTLPKQRQMVRQVLEDPENNMYQLILHILRDTDTNVLKATFENFFPNATVMGWKRQEELREKYQCNIPWAILWIRPVPVICTAPDAGQQSTETG